MGVAPWHYQWAVDCCLFCFPILFLFSHCCLFPGCCSGPHAVSYSLLAITVWLYLSLFIFLSLSQKKLPLEVQPRLLPHNFIFVVVVSLLCFLFSFFQFVSFFEFFWGVKHSHPPPPSLVVVRAASVSAVHPSVSQSVRPCVRQSASPVSVWLCSVWWVWSNGFYVRTDSVSPDWWPILRGGRVTMLNTRGFKYRHFRSVRKKHYSKNDMGTKWSN